MKGFRRIGIVLLISLSTISLFSQRLNTGFSYDFYGLYFTRFPNNYIFSETNFKAYNIKQFQVPSQMQQNYGVNIIIDYSRFFINTRLSISSPVNGLIYKFSYPIGGNKETVYYSKVQFQGADLSASFGYFLKVEKLMKPYLEAGIGRSMPYFYREDLSTDRDFLTQWLGRQEIKKYMGLYKPFNFLMIGIGYRGNMTSIYTRYNIRIGHREVFYSNLSFGIAFYTRFSNLRKHYIYQPEE
jgi:hypothetical protein